MSHNQYKSKLLISDDYWAIWLGGFFLVLGIIIYLFIAKTEIGDAIVSNDRELTEQSEKIPYKSIDWYKAKYQSKQITGSNTALGKSVKSLLSKPKSWKSNPLSSLYSGGKVISAQDNEKLKYLLKEVDVLEKEAISLEQLAQQSSYKNEDQNKLAANASKKWNDAFVDFEKVNKKLTVKPYTLLPKLILFALILAMIFGLGAYFMGHGYIKFIIAFLGIFLLATISYLLASQVDMKNLGISYAVWAILLGLIISNTIETPEWLKPAVQTEYYIKTGLVLLGAEILLGKIMTIGLPGIFVSWVVTPIVLVSTYWFGQKILKIGSKTLNITISADMSVCGVSAAIATAAACNAKKEELTLAIGLSMVFTSIMMIVMPAFINAVGMPEVLGGAWIGGTIDATGAVVAAGAFLGDKALNVAATIKMIQNVLIGIIAFGVAVYWATKVENNGKANIGADEIWKRFPKFILGFLGASIVFSIIYALLSKEFSYAFIDHGIIRGFTKDLRGWLFCLAFVSIGLSVNFKELKGHFSGGKPLILYLCGQTLNLILTLLMAYIMFYIVFPEITNLI